MINKKLLQVAVAATLSCSAISASAALPVNAILTLDPQTGFCDFGLGTYPGGCVVAEIPDGNYFAMDNDGSGAWENQERVGFDAGSDGGLTLASSQPTFGTSTGSNATLVITGAGQIDAGWGFFGAAGWHITTVAPTIVSDNATGDVTLGMAGWTVNWNGGDIDMGQGADAIVTCANTCEENDSFTFDYNAVVPSGGFAGVAYQLHMTGIITLPLATNDAPVANPDAATVDRKAIGRPYTSPVIDILANDTDVNGISDIDRTTVNATPINGVTAFGTFVVDAVTGNVTYTPNDGSLGIDTFNYVVSDKGGPTAGDAIPDILTSNVATVTITVVNAIPVAVNDSESMDTSSSSSVPIDVTFNDTDSDGTIDKSTVIIVPNKGPANGVASVDAISGVITYTPSASFVGTDTMVYTVEDNDTALSNEATVTVVVSNSGIGTMPPDAYLTMTAGNVGGSTVSEPADGNGSWFHMEVAPGQLTFVSLTSFNGISMGVGNAQAASAAFPDIDLVWPFFGNLGIHQTTSDVVILTDDAQGNVTLDFSGWDVSWNNIASIPMSSRAQVAGFVDGIAQVTCLADCGYGDSYILEYSATVPDGDPSGFGNVKYFVHLEGIVSDGVPKVGGGDSNAAFDVALITAIDGVLDIETKPGSVAQSVGNTTGTGLSVGDTGKDPQLNSSDGRQCIGGCIDIVINNVTTAYVDLVFKLSEALPSGAIYRKLLNGTWRNFDKAQGDVIGSAESQAGLCQRPEGVFSSGLREGFDCIYMRIYDNGPNDADATLGTIADPSGALVAGSSNVPSGSTSGCSISNTNVALTERADWFIVAGFIVWLGLIGYRRNKALS